jgi:hypothetical protein
MVGVLAYPLAISTLVTIISTLMILHSQPSSLAGPSLGRERVEDIGGGSGPYRQLPIGRSNSEGTGPHRQRGQSEVRTLVRGGPSAMLQLVKRRACTLLLLRTPRLDAMVAWLGLAGRYAVAPAAVYGRADASYGRPVCRELLWRLGYV